MHIKSIKQNYCISIGLISIKIISLLPPKTVTENTTAIVDVDAKLVVKRKKIFAAGRESFFHRLSQFPSLI